jgi:Fur family ferric uptake transcriptional regulator
MPKDVFDTQRLPELVLRDFTTALRRALAGLFRPGCKAKRHKQAIVETPGVPRYKAQMSMDARDILKSNKLKATAPRLAILEMLIRDHGPFRIEEIQEKLGKKEIDLATVYRTVAIFERLGIARRVEFGDAASRYEFHSEKSHHHHLICISCRTCENIEDCFASRIEKEIRKRGYLSISHSFEVFGICPKCQEKGVSASHRA